MEQFNELLGKYKIKYSLCVFILCIIFDTSGFYGS